MRILHAPLNIANDAFSLSRAERALGHQSEVAVIAAPAFSDAFDIDLRFEHSSPVARQVRKLIATEQLLRHNDVVHYSYAHSVVDYDLPGARLLDMRRARQLRRVVAMTFHGCDVRPVSESGCEWCSVACSRQAASRRLDLIRKNADLLYVRTPDLLAAVEEAEYVPQFVLGLESMEPAPPRATGPLRVVHAPSDRGLKGTRYVEKAIDELWRAGHEIELVLVEGMSHAEALRAYVESDVAVDQLMAGWYGVFAIELMALGKPVICRIDPIALQKSAAHDLPIVNATPDSLADVLAGLIRDRAHLPAIGQRSREWALRWHDSSRNASRLVSDYAHVVERRGAPSAGRS